MVLVLGRRLPQTKNLAGECDACTLAVKLAALVRADVLCAVRRGVGADGVERHAADGAERPAETLQQTGAARCQNEGAVPGREARL